MEFLMLSGSRRCLLVARGKSLEDAGAQRGQQLLLQSADASTLPRSVISPSWRCRAAREILAAPGHGGGH